ncbi:MGDG synthase family glycosyltransferase [Pyrinomonas methylaliphatogenes]|uniref:UDP-N-acetylglucosamine:LPS N-acetylglucosamine transferase n=1 Tax=Pyrinomonas methylaliphatogenes TaxID=454194 RepID=A0A0B6WVI9_9BACT|nr:hypothetical protein [Pyrinomonas methylaliphatogenes]MBX5477833.1 hypothetical protein [Pyrinomonas methylaliphatogenes]CDM64130.1 UDP-N-acetylglucosamine:LPS N-acetylglucosamine transferase [Pyrinomonas methylaliphatogenes]
MRQIAYKSSFEENVAMGHGPIWLLAIANGAGHMRTASSIASALRAHGDLNLRIIEISSYMSAIARFTHVTAYLWLLRYAPTLWDRIDRYQKQRPRTSPAWYYRLNCRQLFELARSVRPQAMVATEVGCCEIAALIKRDLALDCPIVAVNTCYDADRAWVQPEVDLYGVMTESLREAYIANGAPASSVVAWGLPLAPEFKSMPARAEARKAVCQRFELTPELPLLLIAGGGEGLNLAEMLDQAIRHVPRAQLIVLAGRCARLKEKCEKLAAKAKARVRVLGWTDEMPLLMRAADLAVSKLGNFFDEALVAELPIVAPLPPPGAERAQHSLLELWGVGCAAKTAREAATIAARLLADPMRLERMRRACRAHKREGAADRIAAWIIEAITKRRIGAMFRHDA